MLSFISVHLLPQNFNDSLIKSLNILYHEVEIFMKELVRGKILKENRCFRRNTNKISNSKHSKNQLLIMVLFITIELPY